MVLLEPDVVEQTGRDQAARGQGKIATPNPRGEIAADEAGQ